MSAPWATAADLPQTAQTPNPPSTWAQVLLASSELLYLLSGSQWRGQGQSRVQVLPADHGESAVLPGWVPLPVYPDPGWGAWAWRGRQLPVVVKLPSSPVVSVDTVTVGGTALASSAYRCDPAGLLERTDGNAWPLDGSLLVTFTHGIAPPQGGKDACVSLAVELAKLAGGGGGSSRLANVFTSVVREGTTITPVSGVSLRDALTGSLTGLPEVDVWLTAVNPTKARRRPSAWSPDFARTRRVTA